MTGQELAQHGIRETPLADGVRLILPRIEGGRSLRVVAAVLFVIGAAFVGFAVFWVFLANSLAGSAGASGGGVMQVAIGVFLAVLGLVPLGIGVGLWLVGLLLLIGRQEIETRGGKLRAIVRIGIVKWTRSRPMERIEQLEVKRGGEEFSNPKYGERGESNLLRLLARIRDEDRPFVVAGAGSVPMLTAVASRLSELIDREMPDHLLRPDQPRVEVDAPPRMGELEHVDPREAVLQPPGSAAVLTPTADGLSIALPPVGVRKGSKGLFGFAVAWLTILGLVAAIGLPIAMQSGPPKLSTILILSGVGLLFLAVGIGFMLGAFNMGLRRAIIDVVGDGLLITLQSLFGTKSFQTTRDEISAIGVGPSGTEVNGVPILELQVHMRDGDKRGFLSERSNDDLRWIAYELNRALGVDSRGHVLQVPNEDAPTSADSAQMVSS